jgi:hypothetical protein
MGVSASSGRRRVAVLALCGLLALADGADLPVRPSAGQQPRRPSPARRR